MTITFIIDYLLIATIMLIYNTWHDIKKKEIDSRFNYIMFGAAYMMVAYFNPKLSLIIIVSIMTFIILLILSWKKYFASGDLEALSWVLFTLGIFSYSRMIFFLIILTLFYTFNLIVLKLTKQVDNKVSGYPAILGSFVITLITFFF